MVSIGIVAVGIEKENPIVELTTESIGIDVGIKDLAICSNGMTFKNINKTKSIKNLKKGYVDYNVGYLANT